MSYKPKVLPVSDGGTGLTTLTSHALYVGNGTSNPTALGVGTTGQALVASTGANPAFGTLPIAGGGTNATSMSTSTGIVKYDGTSLVTSSTALIDSSNRQTNSSQPCFLANKSSSSSNVTGDGTTYTVIFDVEQVDQGSNYDNSTGIFTAPIAGRYQFNANVTVTGMTSAMNFGNLTLLTTGSVYNGLRANYGAIRDSGNVICVSISVIATMAANDTAKIQINIAGGTKVATVFGQAFSSGANTLFSGCLLC